MLHSLDVISPGENHNARIKPDTCELGLGIHGEPGAEILHRMNGRALIDMMVNKLLLVTDKKQPAALLINNLGGLSPLEMSLVAEEVLNSPLSGLVKVLIGPATTISALDMKGFSLTLLSLNEERMQAMLAPVDAVGWPGAVIPHPPLVARADTLLSEYQFTPSYNEKVANVVAIICETLIDAEHELNALDARVGDGDTGTAFANGARRLLSALQKKQLPLDCIEDLVMVTGEHLASAMGGSSGVLMSILFNAAGQKLSRGSDLAGSLAYGLKRLQYYGGAGVGDRTMVDALDPAFSAFVMGKSLEEIAQAAHRGADSTCSMLEARAGRSSYLNKDNLDGIKDPGAYAVELVFAALSHRLCDKCST